MEGTSTKAVTVRTKAAKSTGSRVTISPSVFADDSEVGNVIVEVVKVKREKKAPVEKIDKRAIKREALMLTLAKINEVVQGQPLSDAQYIIDNGLEKTPSIGSKSFKLFVLMRAGFGFSNIIAYMKQYKDQIVHWEELNRIEQVYFGGNTNQVYRTA